MQTQLRGAWSQCPETCWTYCSKSLVPALEQKNLLFARWKQTQQINRLLQLICCPSGTFWEHSAFLMSVTALMWSNRQAQAALDSHRTVMACGGGPNLWRDECARLSHGILCILGKGSLDKEELSCAVRMGKMRVISMAEPILCKAREVRPKRRFSPLLCAPRAEVTAYSWVGAPSRLTRPPSQGV